MLTLPIALLLIILVITLILFSFEWVSADVVALGILLTLILLGLIPLEKAFNSFGSDTVMLIFGLLILTATLVRTGVVELVGRGLQRRIGTSPNRMLLVIMSAAAGLSAFISNTAATAFFIPIVIGMSRRAKVNASQMLMPLAFSSILASSVTLLVYGLARYQFLDYHGEIIAHHPGIPRGDISCAAILASGGLMR